MSELLPWHHGYWQSLTERKAAGRFPHALLFTGPAGIGKNRFADLFVRSTLCRQPVSNSLPCGECRGCQLTRAKTHPDVRWVTPPEEGKGIGVDQIREITRYLSLKSQYGGYKLVIISPADKMNINAANSLLKTLEEPPTDTILILITESPARLTATIRSRCQKLSFTKPPAEIALEWLKSRVDTAQDAAVLLELAEGAPLKALKIADKDWLRQRLALLEDLENVVRGQSDPVLVADKWLKFGLKESLYWIYSWLVDMVRLKVAPEPPLIGNPDIRQRLWNMSDKQEITWLYGRLERVGRALQLANTQANPQLLLEEILLGWAPNRINH